MTNAIWFSRHRPTAAQLAEISAMGHELCALEDGIRIGAMNIADDGDLDAVLAALMALANEHRAKACFGVFPAPIQERLVGGAITGVGTPCYASWNVQRSSEAGKPTFEHKRFCSVGLLAR